MNDVWSVLGIQPTQDVAQIKSAYARQSKTCNPEDDPQGFMRLREAYHAAMDAAQSKAPESVPFLPQIEMDGEEGETPQAPQEATFSFFDEPESYQESAAFQTFSKLYQKANMKNWKLWMEYFVSPEFLEVRHQEGFCALLKEYVLGQMDSLRPGGAFLKALHASYCIQQVGRQSGYQSYSCRQPPASMMQLIHLLPDCSRFLGEDQVMSVAFADYDRLVLIQQNGWDDEKLSVLREILTANSLAYIKDKIPTPSFADPHAADYARHPLGLRLLTYFFQVSTLPEEAYQIAWKVLDLKNAKMGRPAVLYGGLRERCLEQCPDLESYEPQRFMELKTFFNQYWQTPHVNPEIIRIFDREDLEDALLNREFVEDNVLNHWITSRSTPEFLERLHNFYLEHPQAPLAARICQECGQAKERQKIPLRNQEDAQDDARTAPHKLTHRPFLRYWAWVAFPRFERFHNLMQECLPLLPDWRTALFLSPEQEGGPVPPILVQWDGISVQVVLHQFYLEYRYEDQELVVPCLQFQDLLSLGEAGLWLLPLAVVQPGEEQMVEQSIAAMLADTAFPVEALDEAARALTEGLYQWNLDNGVPSVLLFQETELELYGAEIVAGDFQQEGDENLTVQLFGLGNGNFVPHYLPDCFGPFSQLEEALAKARQLLEQLVAPPPICYAPQGEHHSRQLPDCVYFKPLHSWEKTWKPPVVLLNRLWGALDAWDELRRMAKNPEERVDAMHQRWISWTQSDGARETLASQLNTLCGFLAEDQIPAQLSETCIADPHSPIALLDRLQTWLLDHQAAGEAERLQGLLAVLDWDDGTETKELLSFQDPADQKTQQTAQAFLDELRAAVLQRIEPLLDWLWTQVNRLREVYLKELDQRLVALASGEVERLELAVEPCAWERPDREEAYPPMYSLVFQRGAQGISCLYFDDPHNLFYALRWDDKQPGTYAERFVNISQDQPLPDCCQFASFFSLQCHLQEILDVLLVHARPGAVLPNSQDLFWIKAWGGVHVGNQRNKYNLAKQELGGFPLERAMLPISQEISLPAFVSTEFEIQLAPAFTLTLWGADGKQVSGSALGQTKRARFTQAVKQYFDGEISKLRLSWEVDPANYCGSFAPDYYQKLLDQMAGQKPCCHILLTRDGPKMMMLVLEDFTARAYYYVADQWTYMDVERKYPKGTFAGKTVPAYLIHTDPIPLRSQLDLLLDHLTCPYTITTRFAEYAEEKPVRARAYEVIRAEVLEM